MMTQEEIRDAIDGACWERCKHTPCGDFDFNYMSRARRILLDTKKLQAGFISELYEVLHRATDFDHGITEYHLLDSDPNEQAEALLRVLGEWDKP